MVAPEHADTAAAVDQTPISPVTERKQPLERQLQSRPDPDSLRERHILLDTTAAPALQAAQLELERQRLADSLKHGLERRPARDALVEKHILPAGKHVAPTIQAARHDLERRLRKDSLERHLQHRPNPDTLVKDGILDRQCHCLTPPSCPDRR